MLDPQLVNKLKVEIESNLKEKDDSIWCSVLGCISKEITKNPNDEYVSLKNAIRIYLGASNDYDNELFTKLCETQDEIEVYYDNLVNQFIKDNSSLSENRAKKMIKNLKIHSDLYSELVEYLLAGNCYKNETIKVQGYDVNSLCENYQLSRVGAYNYLMYLREEPQSALADLKAGLPRK